MTSINTPQDTFKLAKMTPPPVNPRPLTLLGQPALLVRVEEGVHQIIAVIFWDHERLRFDALVKANQQLPRQVT